MYVQSRYPHKVARFEVRLGNFPVVAVLRREYGGRRLTQAQLQSRHRR